MLILRPIIYKLIMLNGHSIILCVSEVYGSMLMYCYSYYVIPYKYVWFYLLMQKPIILPIFSKWLKFEIRI